jgi:transcriptional regulator with XRE-family HTH domain/tetratricopeptide (TPR) repeat protein
MPDVEVEVEVEVELPVTFGVALRRARLAKSLSLAKLGEQVNYSKSQLSKIENDIASPGLELAQASDNALEAGGRLMVAFLAGRSCPGPTANSARFDVPPLPSHFIGRDYETARVMEAILGRNGRYAPAVLLHGMPGIGKSALASHVAYLARDQYPGGCLFVDFGSSNDEEVAGAVQIRLLRRLGVATGEIPAEPDEALALYRSVLYQQAVLIIADGVTRADQVAALVPAAPACAVLATSRCRLDELDDFLPVLLPPLADDAAAALLRAASRRGNLGRDADVQRVVAACGGLPLALRAAAAKIRSGRRDVAGLADRLEDAATGWPELEDSGRSTKRALRAGQAALPEGPRQTLAKLALHPPGTVARQAAEWLTDGSPRSIQDDFDELVAHDLITVDQHGQARLHNLVRSLSSEDASSLDERSRQEALHRLVAGYAKTAKAAASAITTLRFQPADAKGEAAVVPLSFEGRAQAMRWCHEQARLIPQLCSLALEQELDEQCWRLAYAMRDYFFTVKAFGPWIDSHLIGLRGAEHCENKWAQAVTCNNLGMAYVEQRQVAEAMDQYDRALRLLSALGDRHGIAATLGHQAWARHAAGHHDAAIVLAEKAKTLSRRDGNLRSLAIMDRTAALAHSKLGQHREALSLLAECQEIVSGLDLPLDAAMTHNCLGEVHLALGHFGTAAEFHVLAAEQSRGCEGAGELDRAVRGQAAAAKAAGTGD